MARPPCVVVEAVVPLQPSTSFFDDRYFRTNVVLITVLRWGQHEVVIGRKSMQFSRGFLHLISSAIAFSGAFGLLTFGHSALSQTATVKIVNPYPPGGTADIVARVLGEQIGRTQGVTMMIENRPGGGGTVIGTEAAARAAPDGNTLLITSVVFVI